jgi:hypothetical protein
MHTLEKGQHDYSSGLEALLHLIDAQSTPHLKDIDVILDCHPLHMAYLNAVLYAVSRINQSQQRSSSCHNLRDRLL